MRVCVGGTSAAPAYPLDSGPVGYGHENDPAGITMALRSRNRKMKMGRRRVVLSIVWWSHPSRWRRQDPFWIPAFAGMTNGGPD